MAKFRVLGRALQREDGRGKVTGEAHFTADVIRPGMLWGKILRSPFAHARIVNIDTSRARDLPGVKAVITARDVSAKLTGRTLGDLPILARERVRFVGDKVAQGQIEGGMLLGLGMAVCEEVLVEDGRVTTLSLGDYKIPTARDLPLRKTTLVTGATQGPGPFNAKPAAEHAIPTADESAYSLTSLSLVSRGETAEGRFDI
jgi:CO/xanthine dehydrogenase Mo-binding subunit